jgi:hypothetical protein
LGCSDSISSPRTGVEAILTELGPEPQNRRYAVSSHTAPGEDGITPEMIACAGKPMTRVLTAMFNKCWAAGKAPTRWGIAHVRMLHKRDSNKNKCTNYRGISLLSVFSKMYEKTEDKCQSATSAAIAAT